MLWKIHFRGSSRYLLLPVEFQSATERYMSARALCHIALAYNALISAKGRRRKLAPGGMLPPTLAVTIYNGRERWAAPDDIFDLIEPVRGWLAERQPRLQHHVLDLQALAGQPQTIAEPNVVAWIASMERDPSAWNVTKVVREVLAVYGGADCEAPRGVPGVGAGSGRVVGDRRRGAGRGEVAKGGGNDLRGCGGAEGAGASARGLDGGAGKGVPKGVPPWSAGKQG